MLSPRFKLITFDVYSALLDYEGTLVPLVRELRVTREDPASLVRAWRSKQLEYAQLVNSLGRGRVLFRTLTHRALEYVFSRAGNALSSDQAQSLVDAWDHLDPWPEAEATLREIKSRGYPIGVLSNGDADMLLAAVGNFDVRFDHVFASEHAGYYKPHPAVYALPVQALRLMPREILHVAGSGNDVMGCMSAGLTCAWSNRHGDLILDPALAPDYEMRTLAGLRGIV